MLLDFAKDSLLFQRIVRSPVSSGPFPNVKIPAFVDDPEQAQYLVRLLEEIYLAHGVGYRETTYRGLIVAGLKADRVPFVAEPVCGIGDLGATPLRCLVVGGRLLITVSALGDELSATDRAVAQTYLRWLDLPWGLAVHFGKRSVSLRFIVRPKKSGFTPNPSAQPLTESRP
jgi:hypothetical protein